MWSAKCVRARSPLPRGGTQVNHMAAHKTHCARGPPPSERTAWLSVRCRGGRWQQRTHGITSTTTCAPLTRHSHDNAQKTDHNNVNRTCAKTYMRACHAIALHSPQIRMRNYRHTLGNARWHSALSTGVAPEHSCTPAIRAWEHGWEAIWLVLPWSWWYAAVPWVNRVRNCSAEKGGAAGSAKNRRGVFLVTSASTGTPSCHAPSSSASSTSVSILAISSANALPWERALTNDILL